ncbi:MAG: ROK family protein [Bacillota bacterium]|nr:ROK family protein [Bacillota bacterium]
MTPMRKAVRNAAAVKKSNRLDIISLVLQGPVSRAEIARRTGLTRAAVTIIVDRMIQDGVLVEAGERTQEKGRNARMLHIQEQRHLFMGIDIHRNGYSLGITDLRGQTIRIKRAGLAPDQSFDQFMDIIAVEVNSLHQELEQADRLQGIGISVPGPVDYHTGQTLNPPHFDLLRDQNVLSSLKDKLPVPAWVENNAAARTLFELYAGLGRSYRNFMVLIVDTGVGSGLVLDGRLYRGSGFAGEIGHMSINREGPVCVCGNRGCLEGYAAVPALLSQVEAFNNITSWQELVDGAESGDVGCLTTIETEAGNLAQGIVNATNLLDLEAVILTGDVVYKPILLLQSVDRLVQAARIARQAHALAIKAAVYREDAGMAGAAMIAMNRFFEGQTINNAG